MISPVIVERLDGFWTARCISPNCGAPHTLLLAGDRPDTEKAADIHLKHLNRSLQEGTTS